MQVVHTELVLSFQVSRTFLQATALKDAMQASHTSQAKALNSLVKGARREALKEEKAGPGWSCSFLEASNTCSLISRMQNTSHFVHIVLSLGSGYGFCNAVSAASLQHLPIGCSASCSKAIGTTSWAFGSACSEFHQDFL